MTATGDTVRDVLVAALREPACLTRLTTPEWDILIRRARRARLLGRLAHYARTGGGMEALPARVRGNLAAGAALAGEHERMIRWELNRIDRALNRLAMPVILLKGAAYVAAGLPAARGRLVSDIDIMVPKPALDDVEAALMRAGWGAVKLEPYDQRYYRTWMHELPPMEHRERRTSIDVHHTILPETGRLRPDPGKLLAAARPLHGSRFHVLAPADMLLHSAAHMFQDGDLGLAIRDLADQHDMLRHFGEHEPGFWEGLCARAEALDLARPLYYALRFTTRLFATPVPAAVIEETARFAPPAPVRALMDWLVPRAMLPGDLDATARAQGLAAELLYIRSHWLRMPPHLLTAHLTRKALRRFTTEKQEPAPETEPKG